MCKADVELASTDLIQQSYGIENNLWRRKRLRENLVLQDVRCLWGTKHVHVYVEHRAQEQEASRRAYVLKPEGDGA